MDHNALADELLNARFHTTQFRNGYAEREVDYLIATIVGQVRAGASAAEVEATVSTAMFPTTGFRRGYDIQEVDDFLDDVVRRVATLESPGSDAAAESKPAEREPTQSALIEPEPGLGAKLLRMIRGS